jgi:surfeit locus 1 family protein
MSAMRRLLVPAISTAVMLVILLSLGVWQVQRLAWKHALLAQIDAAEQLPAIPLPDNPTAFQKVRIEGHLRTDLHALYGAEVRGDTLGGQLIMPLERAGADPVLVDLGWVPGDGSGPLTLPSGAVEGFLRPAEHAGRFSGTDNPAKRLFYTLDPAPIGAALGLPRVAPYTLIAIGQPKPGVFPDPATALPRPPDNHLQYAMTWFGFAITLMIIFGLYARKTLRA